MLHEDTINHLLLSLRLAHHAIGAIFTDVSRQGSWIVELLQFIVSALPVNKVDQVDVGALEILYRS